MVRWCSRWASADVPLAAAALSRGALLPPPPSALFPHSPPGWAAGGVSASDDESIIIIDSSSSMNDVGTDCVRNALISADGLNGDDEMLHGSLPPPKPRCPLIGSAAAAAAAA